jgi:hypothetical protein
VKRVLPRHITILVVISVVINVILAAVISFVAVVALGNIHDSQLSACRASNTARHRDVAVWNRLLKISPAQAKAQTAAGRAELAQLKALVAKKDTQVNCAALYNTHI